LDGKSPAEVIGGGEGLAGRFGQCLIQIGDQIVGVFCPD